MRPPNPGLAGPLASLPGVPLLDVVHPPSACDGSPQAYCWGILTANLAAIHASYGGLGSARVLDRLHGLLALSHRHLVELVGAVHTRLAVQMGRTVGVALIDDLPSDRCRGVALFPGGIEANWWAAATQAATALALWRGIDGHREPADEEIIGISRILRAGILTMFEEPCGDEIIRRLLDEDGEPWLLWASKVYVANGGRLLV